MIDIDGLIFKLVELKENGTPGETPVVIDTGIILCEVEDVDLGASDEGVVLWCGDRVE